MENLMGQAETGWQEQRPDERIRAVRFLFHAGVFGNLSENVHQRLHSQKRLESNQWKGYGKKQDVPDHSIHGFSSF
jgi:hypothetical protein